MDNLLLIKSKVENFVLDDTWVGEFLLDCFFNKQFFTLVSQALNTLSNKSIKSEEIDCVLNKFKRISNYYLYKYKKSNNVDDLMNCETYWMFIELATNNSILTKNIENDLKSTYGDDYLVVLTEIDKLKKSLYYKDNKEYIPCERNYICIKKWQDTQHKFVSDGRLDYLYQEMDKHYPVLLVTRTNFDYKFTHYLTKLKNKNITSIDDYTKLYLVYKDYDYNSLIGGKGIGLVKLNSLGLNVPYAYFVDDYSDEIFKTINKRKHYAFRSSADIEDGTTNSFAGIFESKLDVSPNKVKEAIEYVKSSINSQKAKLYFKHIKLSKKPKMHIILQEYIDPEMAGVWMGDKEDLSMGILEYVKGSGDKLVSGQQNPDRFVYDEAQNSKNKDINIIASKMVEVQKKLNIASDIEWCFKSGVLYFLQARYATTDIKIMYNQYDFDKHEYKATPASPGIAIGRPILLNNVNEFVKPQSDEILLTWFTDPEWVPIMREFKGIITAVGGFLSHAAIICREMNIPCIVEMDKQQLFMLKDVKKIQMDGSKGTIKILER